MRNINQKNQTKMKKLFFVSAVLFAFCFASCKKEYTCTCTYTSGGVTYTTTATIKDTKKNAKTTCDALGVSGYTCSLN